MARREQSPRFQHSLWDRLTDPTLVRGDDMAVTVSSEVERVKREVRRDLEWLLNSRSSLREIPPGLDALEHSVVRYGLPDLSSLDLENPKSRERFQQILAAAIRNFEPRLDRVEVHLSERGEGEGPRHIHYRVDALLKLDPTPLAVVFDTVLELSTKAFRVDG